VPLIASATSAGAAASAAAAPIAQAVSTAAAHWFVPGSLSFEIAKGIPAAVITAVVGLFVAGITLRQYNVARAKLNLDLFNERYALFELLWGFLSARVGDIDKAGAITTKLQNSVPKFYFLFGAKVGDFVNSALSRAIVQDTEYSVSHHPYNNEAAAKAATSLSESYKWFLNEANKVRDRFAPYLDFESWRSQRHDAV
jgi:hypothetical protein